MLDHALQIAQRIVKDGPLSFQEFMEMYAYLNSFHFYNGNINAQMEAQRQNSE